MQDAVRLYRTGDEGTLLTMNIRKLEHGCSEWRTPETTNEKAQDGDDESLTPSEARIFLTFVGDAMYLSHHRADIQHSVNTFSRSMRNPTMTAMRRLKQLTQHLLGTIEV